MRSEARSRGRGFLVFRTANCRRSAMFSRARSSLGLSTARMNWARDAMRCMIDEECYTSASNGKRPADPLLCP
jgi:hypothetical protein